MKYNKKSFQFLIARHGESIWSKQNRFTGWTDIPMTENGIFQSNYLAKTIIKNLKHWKDVKLEKDLVARNRYIIAKR